MSEKKPTPIVADQGRVCPVCGKRSYSAAGVHPQCAMKRADEARQKQRAELPPKPPRAPRQRSFDKKCPKCEALVHVRKKVCPCGYVWPEK
jgi:RNA polymerase subunit RPABC4/transcription elongation factor Spt4